VRIDYLKPSPLRPSAYHWLKKTEHAEDAKERQTLKAELRRLQQEMREIEEEKRNSMRTVKLKFIMEENAAKESALKKKRHMQQLLNNVEEESTAKMTVEEKKQLLDMINKLEEDAAAKEMVLRKLAVKEKKQLQDGFKKLEEALTAKEIALRKAISSLVYEEKLKKGKKLARSCFKQAQSWFYKRFLKPTKSNQQHTCSLVSYLSKYFGRDFADVLSAVAFTRECPSGMGWFRFFAFVFGVLPEVVSLLIMAVAGVQYILWSGFKVDSDTQGMEEIILATLAINFIYEIDDAVYDHVFPELYKDAHERDRFDITGFWISSETAAILKKCQGSSESYSNWRSSWFSCCFNSDVPPEIEIVHKMEREMKEEEGLRSLSRCDPIKWETDSKHPLAHGYFLGMEVEESGNTRPIPISCSASLVFSTPAQQTIQVQENERTQNAEIPNISDSVGTTERREVWIFRCQDICF
jgi:hypothetical protein